MFYIRGLLAGLGFVAASLYGVAIALVRRDRSRVATDYGTMLSRLVRPALGVRVRVEDEEKMHAARPCIYLANHQSFYDVPVLGALYPDNTVVIGKKELKRIPFFGWLFAVTGNIMIDRSDNTSAVQRLGTAEEAIRTRGVSIWIFPEGTRGRTPGTLLPFKKGAFYMAVAAGVPLVPVVSAPLDPLYNLRERRMRPGVLPLRVLDPIPTHGLSEADVPELLERTRERMQAALDELRAIPDS